jgi:hypothetical protein
MRGAYGSETSLLNRLTRALSSQTSMSHLVPLLEFNPFLKRAWHLPVSGRYDVWGKTSTGQPRQGAHE